MWFLALAVLALAGCGAAAAAANLKTAPLPFFQVDPDSPLYEPALRAARAWKDATGLDVRVGPDGDIPIFFVEQLSGCTELAGNEACSFKGGQARIEVLGSTPAAHLQLLLTHEMGHHLRGDGVHIVDNPLALMATPTRGKTITAEDVAFICAARNCGD